jgi:predicted RND superfamily exporter protein
VANLKSLLAQFSPPPLQLKNIPRELRDHLVSQEGDYALYIYPKKDLWKRADLEEFEKQVEQRVASIPAAPPVTGITSNIYHTTRAIERAFYAAAGYSLTLIFILVLIDLRDIRQTLVAVSVLALGLPMLVAVMGAFGVSWNFANFFGLPILIGAGHEYGVFMMHRYREALHDPRRVWRRWDPSDRALLLCAFVTSSSFGFFWALAHHRGLESLGLVMAVGTACIYLATILVVRPLLTWHLDAMRSRTESDGLPAESEQRATIGQRTL